VYGDPDAAARYWQPQRYDDCSLMAVADVVGQLTGDLPSEREIIDLASDTASQAHPGSIYIKPTDVSDPNTGMGTDPRDVVVLLEQYGVDAVITDEETDAGRRAQVAQQLEHARRRRQDVLRERERRAAAREALARARATALEDAYRCLSALRRLELETA